MQKDNLEDLQLSFKHLTYKQEQMTEFYTTLIWMIM